MAAVVLGLVGTACGPVPTPQMELAVDLRPAGTYEVLTKVVTLETTVSARGHTAST